MTQIHDPTAKTWMTVEEVAQYLGVRKSTVYAYVSNRLGNRCLKGEGWEGGRLA